MLLTQKQQLEQKVKCYKEHREDPHRYYGCVRAVEEQLLKDSDFLRQTFAKVEVFPFFEKSWTSTRRRRTAGRNTRSTPRS